MNYTAPEFVHLTYTPIEPNGFYRPVRCAEIPLIVRYDAITSLNGADEYCVLSLKDGANYTLSVKSAEELRLLLSPPTAAKDA